jgi:hypothetical protein
MDLPETAGELFSFDSYEQHDMFLKTVRRLVNVDSATQKPLAGVSGAGLTRGERALLKVWLGYPLVRPPAAFIRGAAAEEGELEGEDHRQQQGSDFRTLLSLWDQEDYEDVRIRRTGNHTAI